MCTFAIVRCRSTPFVVMLSSTCSALSRQFSSGLARPGQHRCQLGRKKLTPRSREARATQRGQAGRADEGETHVHSRLIGSQPGAPGMGP